MPYSTSGRTVTYSYTHLMFLSIAGEAFGTPSATHRGIAQVQNPVIQSIPFEVKPAELLRAAKELQMEGVIAKCKGSLYEPDKRSRSLAQIQDQQITGVRNRRLYLGAATRSMR